MVPVPRSLSLTLLLAVAAGWEQPQTDGGEPPAAADTLAPEGAQRPDAADAPGSATDGGEPQAGSRPATRTDTIHLEGMPEPIALRLFSTPDDFPLPFTAYVPEGMDAEASIPAGADDSASVHFVAEFGGVRNEDAFVHVFVFAAGTPAGEAAAHARAYQTRTGIPVSRGVEPLPEPGPPGLEWAREGYRFRYQGESGPVTGVVGVGEHEDRPFIIVRHYPAEYGDGFGPRAGLIMETWLWEDGTRLTASRG